VPFTVRVTMFLLLATALDPGDWRDRYLDHRPGHGHRSIVPDPPGRAPSGRRVGGDPI
jgi:hypothetical protein